MTLPSNSKPEYPNVNIEMAQRFLAALKGTDKVCWQTFGDNRKDRRAVARIFHGSLEKVKDELLAEQCLGAGIYVVVNRTDGKGRKTENVVAATAVFVDGDNIPLPESWLLEPHIIVQRDDTHWHAYWLIESTTDFAKWSETQRALARALGTDPVTNDPPRVMRVPGFWHLKGEPVFVKLVRVPDPESVTNNTIERFTLEEINQAFSLSHSSPGTKKRKRKPARKPTQVPLVPLDLDENIQLAIQYLQDDAPIAVDGDQGDATTLQVAARLKDFGISQQKTEALLGEHWNPRCTPPWDQQELTQKIRNAWDYCTNSEPGSASKSKQSQGRFERCLRFLPLTGLGFAFDTFSFRPVLTGDTMPWKGEMSHEITDELLRNIRVLMINKWKFDPGKGELYEAAMTFARQHPFHPVVDYLNGLHWDGIPRLNRWLSAYLGAPDTPYTQAVGTKVLMAAVARVCDPGCKFDTILVLEGKQGTGKSSAIKNLAGEQWYSDGALTRLNDADAVAQIQGIWIYELGEMVTLNKGEVDSLKAFASRAVDRARLPYERAPKDFPRQCIFIGTTNSTAYLRDFTGNRRIWPVQTNIIDLKALRRDRDQLWAEAHDRWIFSVDSIELDPTLWADAEQEQEQRMIEDPWEEIIKTYLDTLKSNRVLTQDLLSLAIMLPKAQQNQFAAKRVRAIMPRLGWDYRKALRVQREDGPKMGAGYIKKDSNPDGFD